MKKMVLAALASAALAAPAHAAIVVDGTFDGAYGVKTATVTYDPNAPTGNFGQGPGLEIGTTNHNAGYDIFLASEGENLFGFLQADRDTNGLTFANLYFDLDYETRSGSDLGFELGPNLANIRAFVPGVSGSAEATGISYAVSADGRAVEFSIPTTFFTAPIAGLSYNPNLVFPQVGDSVRLNLSQSLGYSVAGHTPYGANRLGIVELSGAVPEPATWAMMIAGFGLVGGAMRSARQRGELVPA